MDRLTSELKTALIKVSSDTKKESVKLIKELGAAPTQQQLDALANTLISFQSEKTAEAISLFVTKKLTEYLQSYRPSTAL